ncbi:hypothetical protein [Haladaptatus halobius]|uniref:hypothetical protein n=1 Tax=Haladaptatus halobius TaxID=2884875 RepID=UPI001D0A51D6|nr:hypothetical protein [Haladaptatus halobius]
MGFLVGFLVVVGLLATTVKFIPGFQILLALTASTSLMITVIQHVLGEGNSSVTGEQIVSSAHVLLPICSRPSNRRLLVGDALIRFANGMVSIFFVLIVTDILRIDATIFDHHLEPTAFFGVLLAIETFIVALSLRPGAEIARRAGPIPIAVASILITALFPLFYITIPANPAVVGLLFAFSGLRFAGLPARKALIADQITSAHSRTVDSYYLVRETVAVPSALIGGWLYGINPKLAFGLATVIGLLGVLEFLRFVAQIGWSDSEQ